MDSRPGGHDAHMRRADRGVTAIVAFDLFERTTEQLRGVIPPEDRLIVLSDDREFASAAEAEVAIGGTRGNQVLRLLDAAPRVRWLHAVTAGVDYLPLAALQERGVAVTSSRGAYDAAVAEHAIMFLFAGSGHIQRPAAGGAAAQATTIRERRQLR